MVNQDPASEVSQQPEAETQSNDDYLSEIGKGVLLANASILLLEGQLEKRLTDFESFRNEFSEQTKVIEALSERLSVVEAAVQTIPPSVINSSQQQNQRISECTNTLEESIRQKNDKAIADITNLRSSLTSLIEEAKQKVSSTKSQLERQSAQLHEQTILQNNTLRDEILAKITENRSALDAELEELSKKQMIAFVCCGVALFVILSLSTFLTIKGLK